MGSLLGAADMLGYHSHTPGGAETEPAVEPTHAGNAKRDEAGHDEHDKPARKENRGAYTPKAGAGVSQEAVTIYTTIVNTLSNPGGCT